MSIQFLAITSVNTITKEEEVIYIQSVTPSSSSSSSDKSNSSNARSNNANIHQHTDDIENDLFGYDMQQHIMSSISNQGHGHDHGCALKHQFLLHSAMEIMKKQGNTSIHSNAATNITRNTSTSTTTPSTSTLTSNPIEAGAKGANQMFRGLICILDEYRFYGYRTNTAVNIIIAVNDDILPIIDKESINARNNMVQSLLREIHYCYVEYTLNPFSDKQGTIKSIKFQWQMRQILFKGGLS